MKAVIFKGIHNAVYKEIEPEDINYPSAAEQAIHGVNVVTRPEGAPREGEIQVEAVTGSICTHEASIFTGDLTVPRFPWIAGHEAVHRVTKLGKGLKGFHEGDLVSCCWYHGQWSRIINGSAKSAYRLPGNIADPALWIVEPAASVVNAATYYGIKPGDRVLVLGAGYMGLLHLQLLSHYPLSDLVAVEIKEFNKNLAASCGATEVIDSASQEGIERLKQLEEKPFDITVECSGAQSALDTAMKLTKDGGNICLFAWHRKPRMLDFCSSHVRGHKILCTSPGIDTGLQYDRHWPVTIRLLERGIFDLKPLTTHRYMAKDVQNAMEENIKKTDGFVKSVLLFE